MDAVKHRIRVLVEEQLTQARRDQTFYREMAVKAADLPTYEVAVDSFGRWTALAKEAEHLVEILQRILDVADGTVPEQDDPVTLAKARAEQRAAASPWAPGEVAEAYGR